MAVDAPGGPAPRPAGPVLGAIDPPPPPEVVAAIAAAVEVAWPRPVVVAPVERRVPGPAWRFSGRWWSKPPIQRRQRPW